MDYGRLLNRFSIREADQSNIVECYRIRHKVYCEDNNFEPRSDDGLEVDQDDKRSKSILVKDTESGQYIATARLIMNVGEPLPIFKHAKIDHKDLIDSLIPRDHIAEISRFATVQHYEPKLMSLVISLGILDLATKYDVEVLASAMSPALNRALFTFGLDLYPVGPVVNYHGKRRAYMKPTADIINDSRNKCPEIWKAFDEINSRRQWSLSTAATLL